MKRSTGPDIPANEPAVSLERVRWLGRDFFKYTDCGTPWHAEAA